MNRREILGAVEEERMRQRAKWNREHDWGFGDCSSPAGALGPFIRDVGPPCEGYAQAKQYSNLIKASVLAEEAGEVVKAALDVDEGAFRAEVIQTLAVAWAILEGIPS